MTDIRMELDDLSHPAIAAHLDEHLADMRSVSPPDSVHALDLNALRGPNIRFWSAWEGEVLAGTVALKDIGDGMLEIKSMRTSAAARGKGVGRYMLAYVLEQARTVGATRLLLETGAEPYFGPARALYRSAGFTVRGPFGDYQSDPNSMFMELRLT